ncbi:hypothetical protein SAMN05446934_5607 [Paraburkholderia hospita]|nr:hypothetical protein SAMN05446934_5607 [Paraburkholderia hospita]
MRRGRARPRACSAASTRRRIDRGLSESRALKGLRFRPARMLLRVWGWVCGWHPRFAFGLLALPCAGRHLLWVVRDAGLLAGLFAGIRATVFAIQASPLCGAAPTFGCPRRWVACRCFHWHPRYGVCHSRVAPVRGGTYFWLSAMLGCLPVFSLASALRCLPFTRRPCAGRHLLFFAAAKKSRQKKAANTANSCICLRAPNRSLTSHGNLLVPRSLPALLRYASPTSCTRDPACRARYSTAAQVANCV